MQKKTFTKWVNKHLIKVQSNTPRVILFIYFLGFLDLLKIRTLSDAKNVMEQMLIEATVVLIQVKCFRNVVCKAQDVSAYMTFQKMLKKGLQRVNDLSLLKPQYQICSS